MPLSQRTFQVAQKLNLPEILIADDDTIADLKRLIIAELKLPKLVQPHFYKVDNVLYDNLHDNEETIILRKLKPIKDQSLLEFRIMPVKIEDFSSNEEESSSEDDND
eukprot:g7936.t1